MKKLYASTLAMALALIPSTTFASDYDSTVSISDGRTISFTDTTNIKVTSGNGIKLSNKMGTINSTNGSVTNIEVSGAGITIDAGGTQLGNAIIELGQTHIKSGGAGLETFTDLTSGFTISVKLGAGSTIESNSIAVSTGRNSTVEIGDNSSIKGQGSGATLGTVSASNGSKVILGNNIDITNIAATGANHNAVYSGDAEGSTLTGSLVSIGDNAKLYTVSKGSGNHAVKAGNTVFFNAVGKVSLGDNASILTVGSESFGLYAAYKGSSINTGRWLTINTQGDNSAAVRAGTQNGNTMVGGGNIEIGENVDIQTLGTSSHGLQAIYSGSTIKVFANANITTKGTSAVAVYAIKGGKIELAGGTIKSSQVAIFSQGKDNLDSSAASITGSGFFDITGDILATEGGSIDMNFNASSAINGRIQNETDATTNIALTENSLWKMSAASNLTNLTNDNSVIDMTADNKIFSTLTVQNLDGNEGTIKMDIDASKSTANSDRIYIKGSFDGTQYLDLYEVNGYTPIAQEGAGTILATVKENKGQFIAKDGEGTLYWQHYELDSKATEDTSGDYSTDWYLKSIVTVNQPTTSTDTVLSTNALSYHTWRTENDQIMQRLGELRRNGPDNNGIWFRMNGSKISRDGKFGFQNKYTSYELGYDTVTKSTPSMTRYTGVALSYADGNGSYNHGSGDNSNLAVHFYNTDISQKGHYLDIGIKLSNLKNDFNVFDTHGQKITGDFKNTGIAFNIEYGRKNQLKKGWYFEPQAQFTLGYLGGDSYTTSNGINVEQSGIKTAVMRLGFHIGREVGKSAIYAKANLMHEFGGSYAVTMSDATGSVQQTDNFGDTWLEYGVGAAIQASKNSHIYFDATRSSGSNFKKDWKWNIGARWTF